MTSTYEQKALELDKELAELLGWHRIMTVNCTDDMSYYDPRGFLIGDNPSECKVRAILPRWTQDNHSAFGLIVEYDICVHYDYDNCVTTRWDRNLNCDMEFEYVNFPDKLSAVQYAIVQAVVNKLKGN